MAETLGILIDELTLDAELRESFFRNPGATLRQAEDWSIPLSTSEVNALIATGTRLWEGLAEELNDRLRAA